MRVDISQVNTYGYPVAIGEEDPAWSRYDSWCQHMMDVVLTNHEVHNHGPWDQWFCTLPEGHDGPHVAHYYKQVLGYAYNPLGDPNMRLSEGL